MNNSYFNPWNRSIYKGTTKSASFVQEASPLISDDKAKEIDSQEAKIRDLKKRNNRYGFTLN